MNAGPFLQLLKSVMGHPSSVTAPRFVHEYAVSADSIYEWMNYQFLVTGADLGRKPLPTRDAVVGKFGDANFKYFDGTNIPNEMWEQWVPPAAKLSLKPAVAQVVSTDYPVKFQLGRYFSAILKAKATWMNGVQLFDTEPLDYNEVSDIVIPDMLDTALPKIRKYQDSHPYPVFKRYGFKTLKDFIRGWGWTINIVSGSKVKFIGSRYVYILEIPITKPRTDEWIANYYHTGQAPVINFTDSNQPNRLFGVVVVPSTLPAGTLVKLQGLAVSNVFGERFWIEAAGKGIDKQWSRWSMFTINVRNAPAGASADTTLLLLPTLAKAQFGPPVEEVLLVRDEVANMAWGVERTVALPTGVGRMGSEVATQTFAYLQDLITAGHPPPPSPMAAAVRYQVMNTVPENWIPFIPVHVPGDNRQIQLQREAMPRVLVGAPPPPPPAEKVQPLTSLLREGLDLPTAKTCFIHEEEVPCAGVRATQYYSRTRWTSGEVFVWFRAQKQTGRGEASSGLGFDRLVDQNSREA
jgi:hypothetical protein